MTRIRNFARIAAVLSIVAAVALPSYAARGKADFTTFVAIGDSYGAGFEAGSLNEHHQPFAWPAIIAKQAGLTICPPSASAADKCWAMPLISYPGLPGGESVFNGTGLVTVPGSGAPEMVTFGRPYNDLAVPGFTVGATLALTGAEPTSGLGQAILRGLGTEVDQAIALHPTFIAMWIGGNDFLGAVSQGQATLLTPLDTFKTQYGALLDKLIAGAPNAGIVVGTMPTNLAAVPLTSTLPPFAITPSLTLVLVGGQPIPLIADIGGGTIAPLPSGSIVPLSALTDLQQGYGLPPTLKQVPPFSQLPHTGEPLPDKDWLSPTEVATIIQRVQDYNAAIIAAAAARDIPVADINGLFNSFAGAGVTYGGVTLTKTFITGGLFSNDGTHLSDIGYTLFANQYIKTINTAYGTSIPAASIASQFFTNNGANFGFGASANVPISAEAAKNLEVQSITAPAPPAAPVHRRVTTH
jgi:lysophospholipase L1-like esterase